MTRQIRLGNCTLYAAQNASSANNTTTAYPVNYDPADPNQLQTTIDLTAYSNAGGAIWWTVDLVNTTLDNRRVWEAGYPDGRAVAMLTRQTQRIRWTTSADFNTAPADPGAWFRAGAFWLPTSGAPTVGWLHAGDWGGQYDLDGLIASGSLFSLYPFRIGRWLLQSGYNPANNVGRSFGAYRMISQLAMRVLTMLDSDYTFDAETLEILTSGTEVFSDQPDRGLKQINAALDAVDGLPQQLAVATVRYQGGNYVIASSSSPDFSLSISDSVMGAGKKATITLLNVPTGTVIYGFTVQPLMSFGITDATSPRIAEVAPDQTLPFTGDDTTDVQIEVGLYRKDTGTYGGYVVENGNFTFVVHGTRP